VQQVYTAVYKFETDRRQFCGHIATVGSKSAATSDSLRVANAGRSAHHGNYVFCSVGGKIMRRCLLASTALSTSTAFIAGVAWAADLPVKAPPVAVRAAPFSWTGCYAGLNAGVGSSNVDQNVVVPGVVTFGSSGRDSNFTGGGQLGCNYQIDPRWVIGLEGDFNYLRANRNQIGSFVGGEDTFGVSQQTSLRWLATVRGRFGYAWNRWFFYGTGGLAIGNVQSSVLATSTAAQAFSGSYSSDRTGWTAGAGFEYALAERFSAKLEYLHFDLGTASYLVNQVAGSAVTPSTWLASAKISGDIVRVGFNYRFIP
jgi:outer membrane immunogenic protein